MKTRRSGMTIVEILVVVGIIAALAGLLLPAVHHVQKMAKETKQRAQFMTIELGLASFKNDYGDYPPSNWFDPSISTLQFDNYCGAQKLAEALLGWDLLGFHPDSAWRADGLDRAAGPTTYDPLQVSPLAIRQQNLEKRRDRYIEQEVANAFLLGGGAADALFMGATDVLAPRTYVLCDVFGTSGRRITMPNGKTVTPGTPILYYKANPANLIHDPVNQNQTSACIYDIRDNIKLVNLGVLADQLKPAGAPIRKHPLALDVKLPGFQYFYNYIADPRVATVRDPALPPRRWPVRPDSYLLISAGMDGLYGTEDDICNFGQ